MSDKLNVELKVPFASEREAVIAYNSLSVDTEPRRSGTERQMFQTGNLLIVKWEASEARVMRVSVNGFLDHLALVTQTMEEFGPPMSLEKNTDEKSQTFEKKNIKVTDADSCFFATSNNDVVR